MNFVPCTYCSEIVEVWKKVTNAKSYEVSNLGRVRHTKKLNIKPQNMNKNYLHVSLRDSNTKRFHAFRVATLVGQSFIENKNQKPQINHIDGNKLHNCVKNLEWVTSQENHIHARKLGLFPIPKGNMKFSRNEIKKVFQLRKLGLTQKDIGKNLCMGVSTVCHILLGSRRIKQ